MVAKKQAVLAKRERTARTKQDVKAATKNVPFKMPFTVTVSVKGRMDLPKTLATVADTLYAVQRARFDAQNQLKKLGEYEAELREHLISNINKKDAAGVMGRTVRATIKTRPIPVVDDETAFLKYASRKGNEDLLTHKPNTKAIEERWEAKKTVPGVTTFNVVSISLNKL